MRSVIFCLSLCLSLTAVGTTPIINYSALAQPVTAPNGMVSSQEAIATQVGVEILKQGGNAVDAAVAVGFTLAVTLPRAGNLGGGGFMLVHLAEENKTIAIDYREMAPANAHRDMYLNEDGSVNKQLSRFHGKAIGVPGTVRGLITALEKYGSLSLQKVMQPAIDLASNGIRVNQDLAQSLQRAQQRLSQWPASKKIFLDQNGDPFKAGSRLIQTDLANTLKLIADQGARGFYQGKTAKNIAAAVQAAGGVLTEEDLANYEVKIRPPVTGSYRGYSIASMPPPSSGGTHIIQILNIMENFDIASTGHNSAMTIHLMTEAMRQAYADRSQYLGDPDFTEVPVGVLTHKDYAKDHAKKIDPAIARNSKDIQPGLEEHFESPQTTHFSVTDQWGNTVSNTYTLNFSYGSGIVAKGTGVLLNNEMDDFSAKPGVANAYGLIGGEANAIEAKKRPLSSMSPTIVFDKDNNVFLVTGSPGGSRIITTTLQIISNVIDHQMNIAEATQAPRFHHQWLPDTLTLERGFSPDTIRLLQKKGHQINGSRWAMGSTQSIMKNQQGWSGYSDTRQSGTLTAGH